MTTLACVAGGIVCEGKVLVAEPPWAASRLRRSNFVQTIPPATQAMTTSEHYSTNVQTFVAEDSRRGSDNFRRLPNVAVRSSKPWRDLVSFLLRTHTQHLAPFTAGLFCLESELHFSRNCESGVRNCSLRMWSLVRGQWTCHVVVFVDSTLGYRITLTQHNTDTAFLCMVFGLFALRQGIWF